jgi:hypothetical protein
LDLPRMPARGLAFRAAARTTIDLAEQRKELLSKYGLVEEVLQHARTSIDELDALVERSAEGRRVHIGASASLQLVADEVVRLVRILEGFNRVRFGNDSNLIAGWIAAANIIGPPRLAERRRVGGAEPSRPRSCRPSRARLSRPHDDGATPPFER